MKAELVSLDKGPEVILESEADCLWLWISPRSAPIPPSGIALQRIDWKLQGLISRYLFDFGYGASRHTTFLPSMKRLRIPYVAIDCQKTFDIDRFFGNVEGLQLERVFCLCETEEQVEYFKKAVSKLKAGKHLKKVFVAADLDSQALESGSSS
ncbi:MAG: hypothetical protein KDD51_00880 [Bdellovibrionales bacterium]|nr:hypothetical protein [Bdellovibrionales bacterium]